MTAPYTWPAADALDVTQGPSAYTWPAADALDVTQGDTGASTQTGSATGLSPVLFGTPVRFVPPHLCNASGLSPVLFGTPARPTLHLCSASGIAAASLGFPTAVRYVQRTATGRKRRAHAVGFAPVHFGTPRKG